MGDIPEENSLDLAKGTIHDNSAANPYGENIGSIPVRGKKNSTSSVSDNKALSPTKNTDHHVPLAHKNGRQVYHSRKKANGSRSMPKDSEAKMQERLAMYAVILAFFLLIAYLITRELALLGADTVFAVVVVIVYRYYFYRDR
jgi:hypothetical protein